MKRIFILGAGGLLGTEMVKKLSPAFDVTAPASKEADITDHASLRRSVLGAKPDIIINCAAQSNVDAAESEMFRTLNVNSYGVADLCEIAARSGIFLVHISTDYVFDGSSIKPYREEDPRKAVNFYGYTKVYAEEIIENTLTDYLIFRVAWLIGGKRPTFYDKILEWKSSEIGVIDDQIGDPTFAGWATETVRTGIETGMPSGIYHLTSSAGISRYAFALRLKERFCLPFRVRPVNSAALGRTAARPAYTSLCTEKLSSVLGIRIPGWEEQLEDFLKHG